MTREIPSYIHLAQKLKFGQQEITTGLWRWTIPEITARTRFSASTAASFYGGTEDRRQGEGGYEGKAANILQARLSSSSAAPTIFAASQAYAMWVWGPRNREPG